jgi:hypothetical protein
MAGDLDAGSFDLQELQELQNALAPPIGLPLVADSRLEQESQLLGQSAMGLEAKFFSSLER